MGGLRAGKGLIMENYFEKFKQAVLEADKECLPEKRRKSLEAGVNDFRDAFTALTESREWGNIGMMLRILEEASGSTPVALFPERQSEALCEKLEKHESEINKCFVVFNFERAKALNRHAEEKSREIAKKYTDRHRFVENAIRLIWNMFGPDGKWIYEEHIPAEKAYRFIAESYLYRSKLALPKGSGIPEKKLEALTKAEQWANNIEGGDERIKDLKLEILLEMGRWDKNISKATLKKALLAFFGERQPDFANPLHLAANDKLNELVEASGDSEFKKILKKNDEAVLKKSADPLHLARAACRVGSVDISERLTDAVENLPKYLQTQKIWDDTVEVVSQASEKKGKWEAAAIRAWEKCREAEEMIWLSVQLRWYWSRYRDLYDLAFKAAIDTGDYEKAVLIADSAKSRPAIKMQDAERTLEDSDKKYFRVYVDCDMLSESYQALLERLKAEGAQKPKKSGPIREILDVPDGWTAAHFYVHNRKEATVLLADKTGVRRIPENPDTALDTGSLWSAFKQWQEARRTLGKDGKKNALLDLREKTGFALKPVFDAVNTGGIIFIPHGFFHLVPLHAASYNGAPLIMEKACLCMPAWSRSPGDSVSKNNGENILLSNEDDPRFRDISQSNVWDNPDRENLGPNQAMEVIEKSWKRHGPPRMLAISAHGKGDYMNPYNAKFLMSGGALTHQRLLHELPDLSGTKVVLTACETDLVSGNFGPVDEHLSLANAFLAKNASEVLGTLFEIPDKFAKSLLAHILKYPEKPLYESVREKQIECAEDIIHLAVARVMGFPQTGGGSHV